MTNSTYINLLNFVFFQIIWFSSVFGAVYGYVFLGPLIALFFITLQLFLFKNLRPYLLFIILTCILGSSLDSILFFFSVFTFPEVSQNPTNIPWSYPVWMSALWLGFASTFPLSLSWLNKKMFYCLIFGAIGGPLSYIAGDIIGAIYYDYSNPAKLIIVAIFWALITALIFRVMKKLTNSSL